MKGLTKFAGPMLLASALLMNSGVMASAQTAGQDMSHAGTETKDAAKDTGNGIVKGTKKVWHGTKHVTKKAYHKTKHGTKKVIHASAKGTAHTANKVAGSTKPTPQ